jgi:hypothetical protein
MTSKSPSWCPRARRPAGGRARMQSQMSESVNFDFCHVCGGCEFEHVPVLWPAWVSAWELSEDEARYIDIQQGTRCAGCGRMSARLHSPDDHASARLHRTLDQLLSPLMDSRTARAEINEAALCIPSFAGCRVINWSRTRVRYDESALPPGRLTSIHSDTLEHVADPLKGLQSAPRAG